MFAKGPCSAAVIALTMVIVVVVTSTCVRLVTAAPAYTPRPRQEPPCTHTTHATLCWTMQLRSPLHFNLPSDLSPLHFDLPPQSEDRSSLSREQAGEVSSRSKSEDSMVQPSGSGVLSQKQSFADSDHSAKSMRFRENGESKNSSMLSPPSPAVTSTTAKTSTTTLDSKQQEKIIKEASFGKKMPDVGKQTLDAVFASRSNGAPQASTDGGRMEIPQQQKEYVYHQMALLVADEVGLSLLGKVGELYDHFVLCYEGEGAAWREERSRQSSPQAFRESGKAFQLYHKAHAELSKADTLTFEQIRREAEQALQGHQDVAWFTMETVHSRQKRSVLFNDPAFPRQWHLVNHVETGMDINVTGVWENGITGKGVTVAVVDDGLEWNSPDLHDNYNFKGSWDLNDNDPDPMPNGAKASNHHGTRCAGEIAAVANNSFCGVGVAYGAKVSGIRVLDGPMTDSLEAEAFNKKFDINTIYSCSWGPDDDGKTVDGPHILAAKAMKYGIEFGRHGYGSIFVVASGNGGIKQDNCNYDGYANSIYTVTIGAVDESGAMPYYAEECASMLGVTFSSGIASKRDIVTTDWRQKGSTGCTDRHTGTSASAPLAAGMIALMLEAQPCLTWRDVQYIIIITSVKVDRDLAHWQKNGAGLAHSHKHGFGLISAWRLVNAARVWRSVPWMTSYSEEDSGGWTVPRGPQGPLVVTHTVTLKDMAGYSLYMLEYVQVTLTLSHPYRGKLSVGLVCPSGTHSLIGAPRPHDNSTEGFRDWTFTTVRCWGEAPIGVWTLTINDSVLAHSVLPTGHLSKWRLTLFGTPMTTHEFHERRKEVERAMFGGHLNMTPPCDPPPVTTPPYIPFSEKTLKIVLLVGVFCVVFALYEILEYMLCYGEEKRQQAEDDSLRAASRQPADSTPETTHLLNGRDGHHEDVDWLPLSQTEFDDVDDEDDDMFLLDSGIATQRAQQPRGVGRHAVLGGGATAATAGMRERIPISTFRTRPGQAAGSRNVGESLSEILPSSSAERPLGSGSYQSPSGVANDLGSSGDSSGSHNHIQTAAKSSLVSGKPAKQTLAKNNSSILPDMWQALTGDGGSDSDSQDDLFSRQADSSVSLLHKDVRKSYI